MVGVKAAVVDVDVDVDVGAGVGAVELAATVVEVEREAEAPGSRKVIWTTVPWPRALPTLMTQVPCPSEPQ